MYGQKGQQDFTTNFKHTHTTAMHKLNRIIQELQANANRKLIFEAIYMDMAHYNEFVYEQGINWITNHISLNDDGVVTAVAKCPMFWKWWRNQWEIRDARFVYELSLTKQKLPFDRPGTELAVELYNEAHALKSVKASPPAVVTTEINTAILAIIHQERERLKILLHGKK